MRKTAGFWQLSAMEVVLGEMLSSFHGDGMEAFFVICSLLSERYGDDGNKQTTSLPAGGCCFWFL
ncbi:MAG: hypothetical protein ABF651_08720 [Sporolactobacillus sp.]